MMYKTIVLELIQDQPELHEQLKASRTLPATLDRYALELKASHEEWKEQLGQTKPGRDPRPIAAEALELAIEQLRAHLPSASPRDEAEPITLDGMMNFIRRHTPPA